MKRLLVLLSLILLTACSGGADVDGQSATLRLGWIPSGSFAGEISGRDLFAEQFGLDLEIRPGGPGINTVSLVASGQDTFGTLSADEVFLANEAGADLVIIGVINDITPGAFVALEESGITSPTDFVGRTVGVLPFGSTTVLYEALLAATGVDRRQVTERTISPDLRPFLDGVYEVHPVFIYDETVTLDELGVAFNVIRPQDYGIIFKGPVYFTRREVVDRQPELVEAFVRTMIEGWLHALENKEDAIDRLHRFDSAIDRSRELAVLQKGADYFRAFQGQPLSSDPASWVEMVDLLVQFDRLQAAPDLDRVLRLDWVKEHHLERQ